MKKQLLILLPLLCALTACSPVASSQESGTSASSQNTIQADISKEAVDPADFIDLSTADRILLDQDDILIKLTGYHTTEKGVPVLELYVENNTDEEIDLFLTGSSVNGYMGVFSCKTKYVYAPGEKSTNEYTYVQYLVDQFNIEKVSEIQLVIHILTGHPDTAIYASPAKLYTSEYPNYTQKYDDSGDILYNISGIKIVAKPIYTTTKGLPRLNLLIINGSDGAIEFQTEKLIVNGHEVDPSRFSRTALPDKRGLANIDIPEEYWTDDPANPIETIELAYVLSTYDATGTGKQAPLKSERILDFVDSTVLSVSGYSLQLVSTNAGLEGKSTFYPEDYYVKKFDISEQKLAEDNGILIEAVEARVAGGNDQEIVFQITNSNKNDVDITLNEVSVNGIYMQDNISLTTIKGGESATAAYRLRTNDITIRDIYYIENVCFRIAAMPVNNLSEELISTGLLTLSNTNPDTRKIPPAKAVLIYDQNSIKLYYLGITENEDDYTLKFYVDNSNPLNLNLEVQNVTVNGVVYENNSINVFNPNHLVDIPKLPATMYLYKDYGYPTHLEQIETISFDLRPRTLDDSGEFKTVTLDGDMLERY